MQFFDRLHGLNERLPKQVSAGFHSLLACNCDSLKRLITKIGKKRCIFSNHILLLQIVCEFVDCNEKMSLDDGARVCDVIRFVGPGSSVLQVEDAVERRINDPKHVQTCIEREEKAQKQKRAVSSKVPSRAEQKNQSVEKWDTRAPTSPEVTTFPRESCDLVLATNSSSLPTVSKADVVETVPEGTTVAEVLRTVQRENAPYLVLLFPSGEAASIFRPSYALERGCQYELRYRTSRQTSAVKQFDQNGSSSGSLSVDSADRTVTIRGVSTNPYSSHHNLSTNTKRTDKQHSGAKAATAPRLPRITPTTSRTIKLTKVSSIALAKISPTTPAKARNNTQVPTTVSSTTSIKARASGTPVLPEVTPKTSQHIEAHMKKTRLNTQISTVSSCKDSKKVEAG